MSASVALEPPYQGFEGELLHVLVETQWRAKDGRIIKQQLSWAESAAFTYRASPEDRGGPSAEGR